MLTRFPAGPSPLRLPVFAAFALAAGLVAYAGQPPEVEDPKAKPPSKKRITVEDEDPKGKIKKRIQVDDDPAPKRPVVPAGKHAPDVLLDELSQAAADAPHPAVRAFLGRFVVPFDRLTEAKGAARIRPIPLFRGHLPTQFGVEELDAANKPKPSRPVALAEVKKIEFFEELAITETDQWLRQRPLGTAAGPDGLTGDDQLAAAERLVEAALRFHDYARANSHEGRATPIRSGKPWDEVRKPLEERLKELRLRQLQRSVSGADWQKARQFGTKLMTLYPKDAAVGKEVGAARVAEAEVLIKANDHADRVKARQLLDEFEAAFPGDEQVRRLRKELTAEATRLFDRAVKYKADGNLAEARNDLDRAEALDPTVPGLQDLRREIGSGYRVLYVGARVFPERMSPATARFDSEKQAVELLFEGLLEEVPDGSGGIRCRPGAVLGLPTVVPGGREVHVRQVPRAADGREGFDAHDVVETVKLLRARNDLPAARGLPWLDDVPAPTGPASLRFGFKHGHPDPRALFTFKLVPGRWLTENGKRVDDPDFAARPFGTGPYRIHSFPTPGTTGPRELTLTENPTYGRGVGRSGLPQIKEIRFVEVARLSDPFDDFRRGRLHILPDLTKDEMTRVLDKGGAAYGGKGAVVTAATNRRVHVLAINHRRDHMQNRDLRKGLSAAIDRDEVLNEVYRVGGPVHQKFTAAMTGPFPPASWATVKGPNGQPVPLVNGGEAQRRLRAYTAAAGARLELRLAFPAGDAQAAAACQRIKAQVEGFTKDAPEGRRLKLILEPLDPRELSVRVNGEHRYDLAYVPFDYPDDWYPLGLAGMLDPTAAGAGGRNFTGYGAADTNPGEDDQVLKGELAALVAYQDYSGQLLPRAHRIHGLFNEVVPFVPLWQLDRHLLVSTGLKVFVDGGTEPSPVQVLNPTVLFHNVARWKLE
jgi:ABC-type transport system substrate-binding protein